MILVQSDLVKNTEFRIKWPRGDLGTTPADSEQFMLIEHLAGEFEKLSDEIDTGKAPHDQQQALTLEFFEKRISSLEERIEAIRDAIASLKASNGGTPHEYYSSISNHHNNVCCLRYFKRVY